LIEDLIRRAIVLDLFGGGTVAAERNRSRARLVEIAPEYVDATITWFAKIAKANVVHAETSTRRRHANSWQRQLTCGAEIARIRRQVAS